MTKKATKMTREGGDDKEQRGLSNIIIVAASSNQASITMAKN